MGKTAFGSLGVRNKLTIDIPDNLVSGGDIVIEPESEQGLADIDVVLRGKGAGKLLLGTGTPEGFKSIFLVSVVQDVGSIAADATLAVTFTVTGVAVGDAVILIPPSGLEANVLIHSPVVTAVGTVKVEFENETAAAIDPTSATYKFLVFDLT